MPLFRQLKTGPIEPYTKASITALEQKLADLEQKFADLEKNKVDINTTGITEWNQKHVELEQNKVDVNTTEITEWKQKHITLEENKVDVNAANICALKSSNASNGEEIEELRSDTKSISLYLQNIHGKYCYVLSEKYNFHENVFI